MIAANSVKIIDPDRTRHGEEITAHYQCLCVQRIFHITETQSTHSTPHNTPLDFKRLFKTKVYIVIKTKLYKVNYLSNVNTMGSLKSMT